MTRSNIKKLAVITASATIGWALCGSIIVVGREITSMEVTLIIHAIGAPVIFGTISARFFRKNSFITPMQAAIIFTGFVIFMDFFVVALLIEKSFEMFRSALGTWIPFALIFLSTFLVGRLVNERTHPAR